MRPQSLVVVSIPVLPVRIHNTSTHLPLTYADVVVSGSIVASLPLATLTDIVPDNVGSKVYSPACLTFAELATVSSPLVSPTDCPVHASVVSVPLLATVTVEPVIPLTDIFPNDVGLTVFSHSVSPAVTNVILPIVVPPITDRPVHTSDLSAPLLATVTETIKPTNPLTDITPVVVGHTVFSSSVSPTVANVILPIVNPPITGLTVTPVLTDFVRVHLPTGLKIPLKRTFSRNRSSQRSDRATPQTVVGNPAPTLTRNTYAPLARLNDRPVHASVVPAPLLATVTETIKPTNPLTDITPVVVGLTVFSRSVSPTVENVILPVVHPPITGPTVEPILNGTVRVHLQNDVALKKTFSRTQSSRQRFGRTSPQAFVGSPAPTLTHNTHAPLAVIDMTSPLTLANSLQHHSQVREVYHDPKFKPFDIAGLHLSSLSEPLSFIPHISHTAKVVGASPSTSLEFVNDTVAHAFATAAALIGLNAAPTLTTNTIPIIAPNQRKSRWSPPIDILPAATITAPMAIVDMPVVHAATTTATIVPAVAAAPGPVIPVAANTTVPVVLPAATNPVLIGQKHLNRPSDARRDRRFRQIPIGDLQSNTARITHHLKLHRKLSKKSQEQFVYKVSVILREYMAASSANDVTRMDIALNELFCIPAVDLSVYRNRQSPDREEDHDDNVDSDAPAYTFPPADSTPPPNPRSVANPHHQAPPSGPTNTMESNSVYTGLPEPDPDGSDFDESDRPSNSLRAFRPDSKNIEMIRDGFFHQAIKRSQSSPPADLSKPDINPILRELHPDASQIPFPPLPPSASLHAVLTKSQLKKAIAKLNMASAPSVSGWCATFLGCLERDATCNIALRTILTDVINDKISDRSRHLFTDCVLILVQKPAGGYRPIAITEIFLRLAGRIVTALLPPSYSLFPSNIQLGCGAPGGSQSALHIIQTALERGRSLTHILLSIDFKNAFGSRDRSRIATLLFSDPKWAPIQRLFSFIYKSSSCLYLPDGTFIESKNGALQGEVLSSLAYANSVDGLFLAVRNAGGPNVTATAILDDLNLVGSLADVSKSWDALVRLCTAEGIVIQRDKTKGLWPFAVNDMPVPDEVRDWFNGRQIPLLIGCSPILGGVVGHDEAKRSEFALQKINSLTDTTFRLFRDENIPVQTLPPLLRSCAVPAISHIISTIPPLLTEAATVVFDALIVQTFSHSLQIPIAELATPEITPLLHSSVQSGGIGLRLQTGVAADVSFLCSYFTASHSMPFRFTTRSNEAPVRSFQTVLDIIVKLKHAYPELTDILPIRNGTADRLCINPRIKPHAKARRNLHNAITAIIDRVDYQRLQAGDLPVHVKKTLEGYSNPIARRIFRLTGSDEETRMGNHEARLFHRHYLHLHAFSGTPPLLCPCSATFSVDHPQCCNIVKTAESTDIRHNQIQNATGKSAVECGIEIRYTQRSSVATSNRKPDLHLTFKDSVTRAFADVQVNHTIAPSNINLNVGAILNTSANTKYNRYRNDCNRVGYPRLDFYALIISSFGVFGSEFITLLKRIAKHAIDNRYSAHDTTISEIFYRMVDRILIALHIGNGAILLAGWDLADKSSHIGYSQSVDLQNN